MLTNKISAISVQLCTNVLIIICSAAALTCNISNSAKQEKAVCLNAYYKMTVNEPNLVEDIGDILFVSGLLDIAKFRRVTCRNETIVSDKSHALVWDLIAVEVYVIVRIACIISNTSLTLSNRNVLLQFCCSLFAFCAIYITTKTLYTIVHLLLEEFKNFSQSFLSTQLLCHTVVWLWAGSLSLKF